MTSFSLNLHFPKGKLFCVALVFFAFIERLGSIFVGGMCSICCHIALPLVLAFMHLYSIYF